MSWLSLINGVLKLVNSLADYFSRKQLLDAGRDQAVADSAKKEQEARDAARIAHDNLKSDPELRQRVRDTFTRSDK